MTHPLGRALLLARRRQRVPARTAHPRHTTVIDQDRSTCLQHSLIAGGRAIAVTMIGHPGIHPEMHRGQSPQIAGNVRRPNVQRRGKRPVLRRLRLQRSDLLPHITAGDITCPAIQTRSVTIHTPRHITRRRTRQHRHHRRRSILPHRRLRKRIHPSAPRRLQEDLTPLLIRGTTGPSEHNNQRHHRNHRGNNHRHPRHRPPPPTPPLPTTTRWPTTPATRPPTTTRRHRPILRLRRRRQRARRRTRRPPGPTRRMTRRTVSGTRRTTRRRRTRRTTRPTARRTRRTIRRRRFHTHELYIPASGPAAYRPTKQVTGNPPPHPPTNNPTHTGNPANRQTSGTSRNSATHHQPHTITPTPLLCATTPHTPQAREQPTPVTTGPGPPTKWLLSRDDIRSGGQRIGRRMRTGRAGE